MEKTELVLNYEKFILTQNPFPYVSVPDDEPSVFFDQEKALKTLTHVAESAYSTEFSNHAVVVGPYGSGKSHTLKYIARYVNKQLAKSPKKRSIAFYIPHPGAGILDIYRTIIAEMGPTSISKLSSHIDDKSHYQFELHRSLRVMSQSTPDTLNAWRWLTGERLDIENRNRLGVGRNIDDAYANQVFKQLMLLLRKAGYCLVTLLIDELETVNELDILRRQKLFNAFRHLLDENPRNLSVVFACTPAGWDEILGSAYALARRISRNVIYLESLDEKKVETVLSGYLSKYRISDDEKTKALKSTIDKDSYDIFPFTESAITELLRLSQGNIGEIIKFSNIAIDRALMSQRSCIDNNTLNELLPEYQR